MGALEWQTSAPVRELEEEDYFWGAYPLLFYDGRGDYTYGGVCQGDVLRVGERTVKLPEFSVWAEWLWWERPVKAPLHPTFKFEVHSINSKKMALSQSSVCVSSRLFDKGVSRDECLKMLEDGDGSLPRTLIAVGG